MKHIRLILFIVSVSSLYSQNISKKNLEKLDFLLGDWKISNYSFNDSIWVNLGETNSKIESVFDGKFLYENVNYLLDSGVIEITIYFGFDYRNNTLKLCAMDKEFGVMDIYYGEWEDNKLVFTNLQSDLPFEMHEGKKVHFKLTYSEIQKETFVHAVEVTYNQGKSWFPFVKSIYIRPS